MFGDPSARALNYGDGMTPRWPNPAWQPLDYATAWTTFERRFRFRPSMDPATWPAINEPVPSVTLDLRPVFDLPQRECERDTAALNQAVLDAWLAVLEPGAKLMALDWQHTSFWFDPRQAAALAEPWRITPVPDGDYSIFVTPDLAHGTVGHPWERSLCIFGRPLIDELMPALLDWLPTLRSRLS